MTKRKLPSPRMLRRLINYDPKTGELRWKERPAWMFPGGGIGGREGQARAWNKRFAGKLAFKQPHKTGYRTGKLLGFCLQAHRIAWTIHHGQWPDDQVDHVNGIRSENRILNLRDVSPGENAKNKRLQSNNSSGSSGVSWNDRDLVWQAYISVKGKRIHLGTYRQKKKAIAARKTAELQYGFHPNHGRST